MAMATPVVSARRCPCVTPTPGLSRELLGHGASQYKNTGTIKCNMVRAIKKHKEGDASGSSKSKGVALLLALSLVAAVGWLRGGKLWCLLCLALRPGGKPRSPVKGKNSNSSICCASCCTNYRVDKGVVSTRYGKRKGKLTELAAVAHKAIEMRQKAEKAKEVVVLISDSDSDA
jgi:hypothetical protein